MKKGTRIALIVAAVMIVLGFAISIVTHKAWEGLFQSGGPDAVSFGKVSYDRQTGYTVCENGELSFAPEEISSMDLDWIAGTLTIETYDGDRIELREECSRSLSEAQRMRWKLSDGRLSVHYCASGQANVPVKTLTVQVPKGWVSTELQLGAASADLFLSGLNVSGKLSVGTASGGVRLYNCSCAALSVGTASGDVSIDRTSAGEAMEIGTASGLTVFDTISAGRFELDTASGGVRGSGLTAGVIDVDSGSGTVELKGLSGGCAVKVSTASGSVRLAFEAAPEKIGVDTSSGDVALVLPEGTGVDLDYDTASGDLNGKPLFFGGGDVPVEVDTASGDLTIEYK